MHTLPSITWCGEPKFVSKGRPRKQQPIPVQPTPAPLAAQLGGMRNILGYESSAKIIPMDVDSSKTGWSEFTLADGTVVRVKGVVIDAKKVVGQYAADGKPIYLLQITMVNDLVVPDSLMKPKD